MISRRTFTTGLLAGTATLATGAANAAIPDIVALEPVAGPPLPRILHPIFASEALPGMSWVDRSIKFDYANLTQVQTDIDIEAEVRAAMLTESVAEVTHGWLAGLYKGAPKVAEFDTATVPGRNRATFIGDIHAAFGQMILDAAEKHDNTVIVSCTALTILQSSSTDDFKRAHSEEPAGEGAITLPAGLKHVGWISNEDREMAIYIDPYANDSTPAVIGHVPPDQKDRKAAIVRTGISEIAFGTLPGYDDYNQWKAVGVIPHNLIFI